jgi:hypothetical protein
MFWTTEVYTDDAAFAAHSSSEMHAAASPVFTELIAASGVIIGETLMAKGLGPLTGRPIRSEAGAGESALAM